jgi:hypothetical protein
LEHIGTHWNTLENIGKHWKTLEHMKFITIFFWGIRLQVWTDLLAEGWVERCLEALEKIQSPGEEVVLPMVTGCDKGVGDMLCWPRMALNC